MRTQDMAQLCRDTPTVTVFDNRGLTVRKVEYNRSVVGAEAEALVTRHVHDATGRLSSSSDPRIFARQLADATVHGNERYRHTLSGWCLRRESRDAGWRIQVPEARGNPLFAYTPLAINKRWEHDALGRKTALFIRHGTAPETRAESLVYGEHEAAAEVHNLKGTLVRRTDAEGWVEGTDTRSLGGAALLAHHEFPHPVSPGGPQRFTSSWTRDALDAELTLSDGGGARHRHGYFVSGRHQASWLTLPAGQEKQVRGDLIHEADDQCAQETLGGCVKRVNVYDRSTRRIASMTVTRIADSRTLQALHYSHDAVGNVLAIEDRNALPAYFRNRKVTARRGFGYDARYRLISASGREHVSVGQEGSQLPGPVVPPPGNASALAAYTRTFSYDAAGNMLECRHAGASAYTHTYLVSAESNCSLLQRPGTGQDDIDAKFDHHGNLRELVPGQAMGWNDLDQLDVVTLVSRDDGLEDDDESYVYGGDGQRRYKQSKRMVSGATKKLHVACLPGMELHHDEVTGEVLHVATMDGRVRALHWQRNPPSGIANDQFRYSLDDHQGSCLLEVDGSGQLISAEEYYPFGGTSLWTARSAAEAKYKTVRHAGKERDVTGLCYYGYRYYAPWLARWVSPDPAGTVDGLNLFCMVGNNPVTWKDADGRKRSDDAYAALGRAFRSGDIMYGLMFDRDEAQFAVERQGHRRSPGRLLSRLYRWTRGAVPVNVLVQNDLTNSVWGSSTADRYASNAEIATKLVRPGRGARFRAFLQSHDRYDVAGAARRLGVSALTDPDMKVAFWRRTSKAGLEFQLTQTRHTVHFAVERIMETLDVVAAKRGPYGQGVTASEFRWLYRHQDTAAVRNQVRFWNAEGEVSHDEVFNDPRWAAYTPTRRYDAAWESARRAQARRR